MNFTIRPVNRDPLNRQSQTCEVRVQRGTPQATGGTRGNAEETHQRGNTDETHQVETKDLMQWLQKQIGDNHITELRVEAAAITPEPSYLAASVGSTR